MASADGGHIVPTLPPTEAQIRASEARMQRKDAMGLKKSSKPYARARSASQIKKPKRKTCLTLDSTAIQTGSLISAYVSEPKLSEESSSLASNSNIIPPGPQALDPSYREVYHQVVEQMLGSRTSSVEQQSSAKSSVELELERLQQAEEYTRFMQAQWEAEELFGVSSMSLTATLPTNVWPHGQDVFALASTSPTQSLQHIVTSTEWDVISANANNKIQTCTYTDEDDWDYLSPGTAAQFQTAIYDPPFLLEGRK